MAGAADFIASDIEWDLGAFNGLPEIDGYDIFEVRAFFGLWLGLGAAAAEELGENVAKPAAGFSPPAAAGAGAPWKASEKSNPLKSTLGRGPELLCAPGPGPAPGKPASE